MICIYLIILNFPLAAAVRVLYMFLAIIGVPKGSVTRSPCRDDSDEQHQPGTPNAGRRISRETIQGLDACLRIRVKVGMKSAVGKRVRCDTVQTH